MIDIIIHQLSNPLTGILGSAQLVRDRSDLDEAQKKSFINEIIHSAERIKDLSNRFLDIKALENKSKPLQKKSINLEKVVRSGLKEFSLAASEKNIKFNIDINAKNTLWINGEPELILDAVQNLISNAIKYGPEGRQIQITLAEKKSCPAFSITDFGDGLNPELKEKIFQKFYRAPTKKRIEGTGLGLSYVREIMEKHNGRIEVYSNPEIGCRFTLIFCDDDDGENV